MKLTKYKVCVYIENEAQLQEARELLERYGECIDIWTLKRNEFTKQYNYLSLICKWGLYRKTRKQITLQELETILKEQ